MNAITAKTTADRVRIAISLIKARRTRTRSFSNCFEMGDGDAVVIDIVERAKTDPVLEQRYPHVAVWRDETVPRLDPAKVRRFL